MKGMKEDASAFKDKKAGASSCLFSVLSLFHGASCIFAYGIIGIPNEIQGA